MNPRHTVRLSTLVSAAVLAYIVLLAVAFALAQVDEVGIGTVLTATATACVLVVGSLRASAAYRALHVVFTYYVGCKYLLFPLTILYSDLSPSFSSYARQYDALTAATVLNFQVYGLLISIVAVLAFWTADAIPRPRTPERASVIRAIHRDERHSQAFLLLATLVISYGAYLFTRLGWGTLSGVETVSGDNLWNLANGQAPLYLSLAALAYGHYHGRNSGRWRFALVAAAMIVLGLLQGSRSAFFATAFDFALIFMIVNEDPVVPVRSALKVSVAAVMLSFVAFIVGSSAKEFYRSQFIDGRTADLLERVSAGFAPPPEGMGSPTVTNDGALVSRVAEGFLMRLADSKAPYYIVNELWTYPPSDYVNLRDSPRRVLNDVIPGTPFVVQVNATQLFEWVYFGDLPAYSGETWGLATVCYVYFGYLVGLQALFVLLFGTALLFRLLLPKVTTYSPLSVVLFVVGFNGAIQGGLPELWIPQIFQFTVSLLLFVAAWRLMSLVAWRSVGAPMIPFVARYR